MAPRMAMKTTGQALIALWLMLIGFSSLAMAYDDSKPVVPTLTVTGTGNLAIAPDMVYVTFGMQTVAKSLAEAQRHNGSVMPARVNQPLTTTPRPTVTSMTTRCFIST